MTKRKAIRWAVMALIVLIAVFGGLFVLNRYFGLFDRPSDNVRVLPVDKVRAIALSHQADGDIERGLDLYDTQISARSDTQEKFDLLLNKSNFAMTNGRYEAALDAAKKAERISSSTTTDRLLARIYEAMDDKQKALSYYEKVLEGMPRESDDMAGRYRPVIEQKVEELRR